MSWWWLFLWRCRKDSCVYSRPSWCKRDVSSGSGFWNMSGLSNPICFMYRRFTNMYHHFMAKMSVHIPYIEQMGMIIQCSLSQSWVRLGPARLWCSARKSESALQGEQHGTAQFWPMNCSEKLCNGAPSMVTKPWRAGFLPNFLIAGPIPVHHPVLVEYSLNCLWKLGGLCVQARHFHISRDI
jgi:hypothetical protein